MDRDRMHFTVKHSNLGGGIQEEKKGKSSSHRSSERRRIRISFVEINIIIIINFVMVHVISFPFVLLLVLSQICASSDHSPDRNPIPCGTCVLRINNNNWNGDMIAIIAACHTETGTRTFESKQYHLLDYLCTAIHLTIFGKGKRHFRVSSGN